MTVEDTLLAMVTAALPDAVLWQPAHGTPPRDQITIFDGIIPPEPPARYAIVYVDHGRAEAGQVKPDSDTVHVHMQVSSIAADRGQATWLATRVRDAITDVKPVVDGWTTGVIDHTVSRQPYRDESVMDRPAVLAVDLYEVRASRR